MLPQLANRILYFIFKFGFTNEIQKDNIYLGCSFMVCLFLFTYVFILSTYILYISFFKGNFWMQIFTLFLICIYKLTWNILFFTVFIDIKNELLPTPFNVTFELSNISEPYSLHLWIKNNTHTQVCFLRKKWAESWIYFCSKWWFTLCQVLIYSDFALS